VSRSLVAWMNGERVGVWNVSPRGAHSFVYDLDWAQSEYRRALSLSLPIPPDPGTELRRFVSEYFDNLLPDNDDIRDRIRARFGTRTRRSIDLLTKLGRDSIGALQLLPPGEDAADYAEIHSEPISDDEIARHLRQIRAPDFMGKAADDVFRISLAGAQEKTALLKLDGEWRKPQRSTPSTHILKLPLGRLRNEIDLDTSVENEWLCGELLRALGLPVATSEMTTFDEQRVLVVERFDRKLATGTKRWIQRLPQEDFCQATGTPRAKKYHADGGPGIHECLNLIRGSDEPFADSWRFVAANFAFWLLAATDGHAKNFSLFLKRRGAYRLTPLYDVLSAWPVIGSGRLGTVDYRDARLAMAVRGANAHYHLGNILPRHWMGICDRYAELEGVWDRLCQMSANVDSAIDTVAPRVPPGFPAQVWDSITEGMQRHAARFRQQAGI
jgi:serine/threonine-protein kinase HipA